MRSIPSAIAADAEDVVWGLETAEALWNRGERVDAIVWLRRAAQAAGDAEQDDRALELARQAAELTEWIANNPALPAGGNLSTEPPIVVDAVDELLEPSLVPSAPPVESIPASPVPPAPGPMRSPLPPSPQPASARVKTAAEAHAGMLDPWAESEAPRREHPAAPPPPPVPPAPAPAEFDSDEVVTSAPPFAARMASQEARPPRTPQPPKPPPAPRPRAEPPRPPVRPPRTAAPKPPPARIVADAETPTPIAPVAAVVETPAAETPTPIAPVAAVVETPAPVAAAEAPPAPAALDLSAVEAFADLPDDARDAFAAAASIRTLARDDEVSGFALAFVLEGMVDLSATIVDAPAERLTAGAVVRARGTIDAVAPVRLVGASDSARIATWGEGAVTEAFRTCPWVEDDLRASGDRLQALVGITMGPLGERLDPILRAEVTKKLQLRVLAEHEVVATQGTPVPGMLVVGGGELELLGPDGTPSGAVVRAGEFVFPSEALRMAAAPSTVRAASGGALVLFAERLVAQELLVTCPPLLEIFAGM